MQGSTPRGFEKPTTQPPQRSFGRLEKTGFLSGDGILADNTSATLHRAISALTSTAIMAFLYRAFVVFVLYSGEVVYFSIDKFFAGFILDRGKFNHAW